MRERLRKAVRDLVDEAHQQRLWLRGERRSPEELGFDDTLLVVVDEFEGFAEDLVGDVLLDEAERRAFDALTDASLRVIDQIGQRGGYSEAVATPGWNKVIEAARTLDGLLAR